MSNVSFNSLSALADVLGALSEHRSHIPYRNTRLTHMLQDTIGRFSAELESYRLRSYLISKVKLMKVI